MKKLLMLLPLLLLTSCGNETPKNYANVLHRGIVVEKYEQTGYFANFNNYAGASNWHLFVDETNDGVADIELLVNRTDYALYEIGDEIFYTIERN